MKQNIANDVMLLLIYLVLIINTGKFVNNLYAQQ